jgi:hypothetical protein
VLHSRQLDRQRDAVQALAQPDRLAAVGPRDGEAGRGRHGPLGEQLHGVAAPAAAGTALAGTAAAGLGVTGRR